VNSGLSYFGVSTWHDFKAGGGADPGLNYAVGAGAVLTVILQWNDAFGASGNDYDLVLADSGFSGVLDVSDLVQNGNDDPYERIDWVNTGGSTAHVVVMIYPFSASARTLELNAYGYIAGEDDDISPADSVWGHPAVEEVFSCAAIDAADPGLDDIETYSSRGPCTISFPSAEVRDAPFITAVDGVTVTGAGGFPSPFYGTSASAPHLAGICALMLDRNPLLTPAQVQAALAAEALDRGEPGFDFVFGHGLVDALEAVTGVPDPTGVWVDFAYTGYEVGTEAQPFDTLAEGVAAAQEGGKVFVKAGSSSETIDINKEVEIVAVGGEFRIGAP
jgi:hypothetical protein